MRLLLVLIWMVGCLPEAEKGDLDGDGYDSPTDCDDEDADVHPGATEVWYDGVDQDCGGGSDSDADGDGADALSEGGDDCNDDDPSIHPGAAETWYDSIDQDCGGGSDDDADGDGFEASSEGGPDCDDADDSIHPEAEEVWYDDVDQDCSGGSDYDADADGYDAMDHGGEDCDDTEPTTNPGCPEVSFNDRDDDCDGIRDESWEDDHYVKLYNFGLEGEGDGILGFGSTFSPTSLDISSMSDMAMNGEPYFVPTGDGIPDILVSASALSVTSVLGTVRAVYLVLGAQNGDALEDTVRIHSTLRLIQEDSSSLFGQQVDWVPDGDLDGIPEIMVSSPNTETGPEGSVFVFGSTGWASLDSPGKTWWGGNTFTASWIITGATPYFGEATSLGDIDLDGYSELAVCDPGGGDIYVSDDGTVWAGAVKIYDLPIPPLNPPVFVDSPGIVIYGEEPDYTLVGRAPPVTQDFSRDGDPDLVLSSRAETPGTSSTVSIMLNARFSDSLLAVYDADAHIKADRTFTSLGDRLTGGGDVNGDGTPELAIAASDAGNAGIYVLSGAGIPISGTQNIDSLDGLQIGDIDSAITVSVGAALVPMAINGDVNDDGFDDVLLGGARQVEKSGSGYAFLFYGGPDLFGQNLSVEDADASFYGPYDSHLGSTGMALANITADPHTEILLGAPLDSVHPWTEQGTLFVLDPLME